MDEILILLLRRGAHTKPVAMTTTEMGRISGMSQQNASKKLSDLESGGYIERGKDGITLTKKAREGLDELYSSMKAAFEGERLEIEGIITKGLGEGGYYVSLPGYRKQMEEKLGFDPYPGTVNIKVDGSQMWKRQRILQNDPIIIEGFKDKDRTYGDIYAFKCTVEGKACALIIPLRTHHGPDILELVCPFSLKKRLGKGEGDAVKVVF
jgi:riboflavin kinase